MQARFLLGPAGSGKTYRCLAEVRAALSQSAEGRPLVFVAPKQATFQLERQLLADPDLPGYTRLRILSFERLAEFILETLGVPLPPILSEEGRVMVLRAILGRQRSRLRIFHATARLPGFARQISAVLRELQQCQLSPARLEAMAATTPAGSRLADKLLDLAALQSAYFAWLTDHRLQDIGVLLDLAARALEGHSGPQVQSAALRLGGLWLDGFAEMTAQELDLLGALIPCCDRATLAFCLDRAPEISGPWLSAWALVSRTCRQLQERVERGAGVAMVTELLPRTPAHSRFTASPVLQHLERGWAAPQPFSAEDSVRRTAPGGEPPALRIVACANPEAEAVLAAREVLRFVRDRSGRFREAAVLVRSLEGYHEVIRRVFQRYDIPLFLDRRESVAHHPLAELTRYALRTVAFGWQHADWFGALKSGLVPADEAAVDLLENEALARGWKGNDWHARLRVAEDTELEAGLERLRQALVPAFYSLAQDLSGVRPKARPESSLELVSSAGQPTGEQLAAAVRAFWQRLGVESQLEQWAQGPDAAVQAQIHQTVWGELTAWLENLPLAFGTESMPLREWLPILETGLANLTVGVIPPALDQVLVGAIDRSRNPNPRLVLVLGLNEGVFPAPPAPPQLLTEADREVLERSGVELGPDRRRQLGRERYYAYIAWTRAREHLVLTYAKKDAADRLLHPSPFIDQLRRLFPSLSIEEPKAPAGWMHSEHRCELLTPLLRGRLLGAGHLSLAGHGTADDAGRAPWQVPELARLIAPLDHLRPIPLDEPLLPVLAEQLYGPRVLKTSVSRIEQFAACPFKFFINSGLRAEERKRFEIDARQRGSFQHEALARFHQEVRAEGREWRDLTPEEARARMGRIAAGLAGEFGQGLFEADDQGLFTAGHLTQALQDFIATLVAWMRAACQFNPRAVELAFGDPPSPLPAWELDLGGGRQLALRGIIDRVDLAAGPEEEAALCLVLDYKSSRRLVDPLLLAHGIQLQLPAYLAVLRQLADPRPVFGVSRLIPAGVFYVNLRGAYERAESRSEALAGSEQARRRAYQHRGRFDLGALPQLDALWRGSAPSGQFSYAPSGQADGRYRDPMSPEPFRALLDQVEARLRAMGRDIFAGVTRVDPYLKGASDLACDRCDFQAICRIDPWTHEYRRLTKPGDTPPIAG